MDEFSRVSIADIREVFVEIARNVPADALTRDRNDSCLQDNLSNIRRAIDQYLTIRKPHMELDR